MRECEFQDQLITRGVVSIRWCPEHEHWIVFAWAKVDGDAPWVDVHPMWQQPRVVPDDDYATGTLTQLLSAVQRTVQRLSDESRSGQMTLW